MKDKILNIIEANAKTQHVKLDLSESGLNKNFKELEIDSLAILNLIVSIEEELGYRLPDEILTKITNVNELIVAFENNAK